MREQIDRMSLESIIPFRLSDHPALIMQDGDLSFGTLDRVSKRLALTLIQEGNDDVVILLPFGSLYYLSLLACMRAGRPAVPIDPSLPEEIRTAQINRIGPSLLLTDQSLMDLDIPHTRKLMVPAVSALMKLEEDGDVVIPQSPEIPDHFPLHRLFTSGSSGQQTLVTISRQAMWHDITTTPALYGLTSKHTLSNIGRYTSSLHINAFWRCMHVGASFMPVDLKTIQASDIISQWLRTDMLMLQGHPSLLDVVFDLNATPVPVKSICHLILGGEPLKGGWLNKLKRWLPAVDRVSYNYSSTETMLIACRTFQMDQVDEMLRIPAGFPAPGKMVRILDETGAELPIGDVGEIFVTSSFIGSSMEGTGATFRLQQDPLTGVRTWQTRDLGRWLPDGSLEHLGRADRQMKINGQRIDPIFVEQCIETVAHVKRSIVFSIRDATDRQLLVAVYEDAEHVQPSAIRAALSERLPTGFIPTAIIRVDQIPVTHRGKPDFEALSRIVHDQWNLKSNISQDVMINDAEGVGLFLQQKWDELLPASRCDADLSVFDQGADSVILLKVISAISDRYGIRLNIGFLIEHVTLNMQLSSLLELLSNTTLNNESTNPDQINLHIF
jgi:acyl-coenzyme A synthetase/AMP-(fatty) acid ligase/acyl carrier protein